MSDPEMNAFSREFVELTRMHFSFLTGMGFTSTVEWAGNFELEVIYKSSRVGLKVLLESESRITVSVGPLKNGKFLPYFDEHLNEQLVDFYVDTYLARVDPGWRRPALAWEITSAADMEIVIQLYATALRAKGGPLLRGDKDAMDRGFADLRRGFITVALEDWAVFVNQVQAGYRGSVVEYTSAVTQRAQLESAIRNWKGDRNGDPSSQIERLDRIFEQCTEPINDPGGDGRWRLLPTPTASRWWRKPKSATGPLAEYFSERER